ncbi:MAG: GNAT family N-acetyltransferase, partial [Pseudomonadota bacterium]
MVISPLVNQGRQKTGPDMEVDIVNVKEHPELKTWLEQFYQSYLEEISVFDEGNENLIAWTNLEPDPLGFWCNDPSTLPFVIRLQGRPIGFMLVGGGAFPYMSSDVDFRIGELFILREFRRQGAARRAVRNLWDRLPGYWEVTELMNNIPAVFFWNKIIGEYTDGEYWDQIIVGGRRQFFRIFP